MLKPTLYYTLFSCPSRACLLTAKLINMDLDLRPVDFVSKENHSEWYLKLNPRHTVPVLVDQGTPICDSHAILSYMVSKYSSSDNLYPKNLLKRAKVDELMFYESGVLFQCLKEFLGSIVYGSSVDYTSKSIDMSHNAYRFLEQFLQGGNYVSGSHLTIADVSINTTLISLNKIVPVDEEKYPKTFAWIERMKSIPDYFDINEKGAYQLYARITAALAQNRANAICSDKQIE